LLRYIGTSQQEEASVGFGDQLRAERERQKYSLDDVAASTKISTRMLRALEEEKFSQLPGGIFNKGFVRAYARFLKLDEERAVVDYLQAAGEATSPPHVADRVEAAPEFRLSSYHPDLSESSGSKFPWGLVALLLVAALAFYGWRYYKRETVSRTAAQPTPAQAQPVAPAAQAPSSDTSTAGASTADNTQSQGPAANPTVAGPAEAQPVGAGGNPGAGQSSSAVSQPNAAGAAPSEPPPAGSFAVTLSATSSCWVSITADGKTLPAEVLSPSVSKTFRAQHKIVIRAGNVGGLSFAFNGQALPPQGRDGQVKTLVFGPTGQIVTQPAPTN
jgi:cytoskeleton protein RodZ